MKVSKIVIVAFALISILSIIFSAGFIWRGYVNPLKEMVDERETKLKFIFLYFDKINIIDTNKVYNTQNDSSYAHLNDSIAIKFIKK